MGTVLDSNIKALACKICIVAKTAANTGTAAGAICNNGGGAAFNRDIAGIGATFLISEFLRVTFASTDTRSALAAGGGDSAAGNGDVVGITAIGHGAADACTACTAGGGQRAIIVVVCDGQLVAVIRRCVAIFIGNGHAPLFQRRMTFAALQGVVAVQLNAHHALGGNSSLIGAAGVDIDIIQRHIGGLILISVDSDGAGNGRGVVLVHMVGDDGLALILAIGHLAL